MKYEAFINDNDIAINFFEAIFKVKKRPKSISDEEYNKLKKEVEKMRIEGLKTREIKEKLNISQHRINSIIQDLT